MKQSDYSEIMDFHDATLLNLNDIGGQPGFLEMLPALSYGPAMYLMFMNLSKELDIAIRYSFQPRRFSDNSI